MCSFCQGFFGGPPGGGGSLTVWCSQACHSDGTFEASASPLYSTQRFSRRPEKRRAPLLSR